MRYFALILAFISFGLSAQESNYTPALESNYSDGISAYSQQDYVQAKTFFSNCIEIDSSCFEAYLGLGHVFYEETNYSATLEACEKAEKIRPFNAGIYSLMGKSYFWLKEYNQAEFFLKRAISLDETVEENNVLLALSLKESLNYKEALFYLEKALLKSPDNAAIWLIRGDLYIEMERYEKALVDFQHAAKLSDNNTSSCIRLAETYNVLEQQAETKKYIDLGKKKASPLELSSLLLLEGNNYRESGDPDRALEAYEKAFELNNSDAIILTHQAVALIDLEDYQKAIEKCNEAIAINPEQMEAYFNRGIALEMIRDVVGACSDWQQAFILGSLEAIQYLNGPVCNE